MIDRRELETLGAEMSGEAMDLRARADEAFVDWGLLAGLTAKLVRQRGIRVLAISGSQGSGKSTLAAMLVRALSVEGVRASAVSIDDFYLSKKARRALAAAVHPLLVTRGVPGTHDHAWLAKLLRHHLADEAASVPRFDKATDDRSGEEVIDTDCLILEGWCVGVTCQEPEALALPINALEVIEDPDGVWRHWVNAQINHYKPIWEAVEFWVHLRVPDFAQVYEWRARQETDISPAHRMADAALKRFIQHYERLTRHLWRSPLSRPGLKVELDADHDVVSVQAVD